MSPGPEPLPQETLAARGSWRAKTREPSEPVPMRPASARCPKHLDGDAAEHWKATILPLIRAGLVSEADLPLCVASCELWAFYRRAIRSLESDGPTTTTKHGLKPHPAVAAALGAIRQYEAIVRSFGIGAVHRRKAKPVERPKPLTVEKRRFFTAGPSAP